MRILAQWCTPVAIFGAFLITIFGAYSVTDYTVRFRHFYLVPKVIKMIIWQKEKLLSLIVYFNLCLSSILYLKSFLFNKNIEFKILKVTNSDVNT
jgi:hypothetical protein